MKHFGKETANSTMLQNDQTGITLPEWQFGRMPEALSNKENRDYNKHKNLE